MVASVEKNSWIRSAVSIQYRLATDRKAAGHGVYELTYALHICVAR